MPIDRRSLLLGASGLATLALSRTSETAPVSPDQPKERVRGIGGLFFRSRDPDALAAWYQEHLGIDPTPTQSGQHVWEQQAGPTSFTPFPVATKYFGSPEHAWMINFRVDNLQAMADQLQAAGIDVKVDPEKYPYGRFARLHDPEGNPIELWEPAGH